MFSQGSSDQRNRPVFHSFLACGLFVLLLAGTRGVADDLREETSLKFVPANASFYSSSLRNGQVFEILRTSKLVARLLEIPAVQVGLAQWKEQWENSQDEQLSMFKSLIAQPENAQLLSLLRDAVSNEIFVFGDVGYAEFFSVTRQLNTEMRELQARHIENAEGPETPEEDDDAATEMLTKLLEVLESEGDKLRVPTTVVGFKLTDAKRAEPQIARLEVLLGALLADRPGFRERLTREKIGDSDFLTFALDGSMIPWEMIPKEEIAEVEAQFDRLRALLSKKSLVVSLGTRDDYLLLSIGESNKHIPLLGQGELLIDRPEFAGLRKLADEPITSVGYVSQNLMQQASWGEPELGDLKTLVSSVIPLIEGQGFDPMVKARMAADVEELAEDLKQFIPEPGAAMRFRYLNGRGFEGYSYNWRENLSWDATRKLSILDHLGGDPLCFVAGRSKRSPENYALLVKWCKRGFHYWELMGVPQLEVEQREMYEMFWSELQPLLARLDKTTSESLIPAFEDGQAALVVDAKLTSKSWHKLMPPSETELPMLEVALVFGISDPDLVKRASSEYFSVAQDALNKLHTTVPDGQFPAIKIPRPQVREFPAGAVYYYKIPVEGFDTWIAPNAGLSPEFLVLSMLPKVTLRLLEPASLQLDGPLENIDRPLAGASSLNFAGCVDALRPWIEYGIEVGQQFSKVEDAAAEDAAAEDAAAEDATIEDEVADGEVGGLEDLIERKSIINPENLAQAKQHLHLALEILKCFQGRSSVSYEEEGAMVTHFEWRFKDLN